MTEIVEHLRDAVGPLFYGRWFARRDWFRRSRARLVEEDQPTEKAMSSPQPSLDPRQLRSRLAAREPVRDEHNVAEDLHAMREERTRKSPFSA